MRALWMASGIAVWALHFAATYGFAAIACARGFAQAVPWAIGAATVVAILLLAGILTRSYARRGEFIFWMTSALAALSLVAVLFQAAPVIWLPLCGTMP
jgi:hypothetical protein